MGGTPSAHLTILGIAWGMTARCKSRSAGGLYLESTRAEQLGVLPGEDRAVREVMSHRIVVISVSSLLQEAIETMHREQVTALIVQDEAGLRGLLTEQDLTIEVTMKKDDTFATTVEDVLRGREPLACCEQDTVADALLLMRSKRVAALPVLNEQEAVTGLVSLVDVAASITPDAATALLNEVRTYLSAHH